MKPVTDLLKDAIYPEMPSPLAPINPIERLEADFVNPGMSIGAHPMCFCRDRLNAMRVTTAADVKSMSDGVPARIAGVVICRQQPGTAKGFVFLSIEDETGIANATFKPDVQRLRVTVLDITIL